MRSIPFIALALTGLFLACDGAPLPTDAELLTPETSFARGGGPGASGAQADPTLEDWDDNGNGLVCVKTVPASGNAAAAVGQRTIVKDDTDGVCPGGFEAETLVQDSDGDGIPDDEDMCPNNPRC